HAAPVDLVDGERRHIETASAASIEGRRAEGDDRRTLEGEARRGRGTDVTAYVLSAGELTAGSRVQLDRSCPGGLHVGAQERRPAGPGVGDAGHLLRMHGGHGQGGVRVHAERPRFTWES